MTRPLGSVAHIRTDVADIKSDVRQLRDKMDNGFTEVRDRFESNFHWQIGFLITTLVSVLGAMAAAIHGR